MAFKVLHRALMGFGFFHAWKSSQIASLPGLWIFLARIQTIFARLQLANHIVITKVLFFKMIDGRRRVAFQDFPPRSSASSVVKVPVFPIS
jgi:hypothetical protein